MGQPTAMNSVSASTADSAANNNNNKQQAAKQKNARANGYRAKELAEIRNSLRPFEQGDGGYRSSSLRHHHQQLNGEQLRHQQLNGEQLRQLESEQLLGDGASLRAASSLSESSTNSDSVSSVQDALNKLTLMGYDEVRVLISF
jgi:hypothetical protein